LSESTSIVVVQGTRPLTVAGTPFVTVEAWVPGANHDAVTVDEAVVAVNAVDDAVIGRCAWVLVGVGDAVVGVGEGLTNWLSLTNLLSSGVVAAETRNASLLDAVKTLTKGAALDEVPTVLTDSVLAA